MVTFLISARFNYTVDEEVLACPPAPAPSTAALLVLQAPRLVSVPPSLPPLPSPSPRVEPSTWIRSVVLTRHRLANKIWLIAPERFLRRFFSARPPLTPALPPASHLLQLVVRRTTVVASGNFGMLLIGRSWLRAIYGTSRWSEAEQRLSERGLDVSLPVIFAEEVHYR